MDLTLSNGLTRYSSAGVRELLAISIPLMLASMSSLLMSFFDRLVLAHYSTEAMNAAVTAGLVANVFSLGAVAIAVIAEVFVGKLNGAKEFAQAARPSWQMIWFSVFSAGIFVPCALSLSRYLVPAEEFSGMAQDYFRVWMLFGPFFPMAGALSAFFIGIGRVKIVTAATLASNLLNVVLDIVLVFGVDGIIRPMGIEGAALATGIAQISQVAMLAGVFFNQANRQKFKTADFRFDKQLFMQCLKIGGPSAIGHMIEISAWAFIVQLLAYKGATHVTALTVGQNALILFAFLSQGLQKGVMAIAANLYGQKAYALMPRLIRSAMCLLALCAAVLFLPLVAFPDTVVHIFLRDAALGQDEVFQAARACGIWVWLFIVLDCIVWVMAGILTAYGDTKFIMVANALLAWSLAVLPTWVFVCLLESPPHYCWAIMNLYAVANALIFSWRALRIIANAPLQVFIHRSE